MLTRPGLSPIFTAVMASRRIFKRLRSYVIYRISVTVQVVVFLTIISFCFNDKCDALHIQPEPLTRTRTRTLTLALTLTLTQVRRAVHHPARTLPRPHHRHHRL